MISYIYCINFTWWDKANLYKALWLRSSIFKGNWNIDGTITNIFISYISDNTYQYKYGMENNMINYMAICNLASLLSCEHDKYKYPNNCRTENYLKK